MAKSVRSSQVFAGWPKMFESAAHAFDLERIERIKRGSKLLKFGVSYLDDALYGVLPDDLILLGAPSGVGKTQFCCNLALSNLEDGRKIHYIALEAGVLEIEQRLKFPLVMERFWADPNHPQIKPTFSEWMIGKFDKELDSYEKDAAKFFESAFRDLFLFYKQENFGCSELIEAVLSCSHETDLIIVDHVHYFDFDNDNENSALKEIAKTVRTLALEEQVPIFLVAHLRKRDRGNDELVAGLDEFHGSSDLTKIATKVITFAPGKPTENGTYETFFRIPKNRLDGGVSRYLGKTSFNPKRGNYEQKYQMGWASQTRSAEFRALVGAEYPTWARFR